ncbi:hypothetical protein SALBM311S_12909 [Streptomyces alboniger]
MSPTSYALRVVEDPADREACFAVRKEVFVGEQGVPRTWSTTPMTPTPCTSWRSGRTAYRSARGDCCTARRPRR